VTAAPEIPRRNRFKFRFEKHAKAAIEAAFRFHVSD
jgi:hypothetical protein